MKAVQKSALWLRLSGSWRASTPATSIFGSKVVADYDSDIGVTNSSGLSAWADQGPLGNDLAQATAGLRMAVVSGVDGHQAIENDGTDNYIERLDTWTGLAAGAHPHWFIVASFANADNEISNAMDITAGVSGDVIGYYHAASGSLSTRALLAGQEVTAAATYAGHAPPSGIALYEGRVTEAGASSRVELAVNGTVQNTTGAGTQGDGLANTPDTLALGKLASERFNGRYYRVVILNANASAGERTAWYDCIEAAYPSIGGLP